MGRVRDSERGLLLFWLCLLRFVRFLRDKILHQLLKLWL
jgi:hypothetical protein